MKWKYSMVVNFHIKYSKKLALKYFEYISKQNEQPGKSMIEIV